MDTVTSEAVAQRCSAKKKFLEISIFYRTSPVAASVTGIYMKIRRNDHAVYVVMWCKPHSPI